ncbi:MAG: LON peptidase substrate-binding domain-containing protein, partial [Acidobacteria bacterium]|nr:LON peptidase substrate-binding domain-containing protein [Acidobacteriota bacterium]
MAEKLSPPENIEEQPESVPETLLLIPLDETVVFPTMSVTLPVEVGDDEKVLLVPRSDGEYAGVGTIATVTERLRLPGGAAGVQLDGQMRGIAGAAHTDPMGQLRVETVPSPDASPVDGRTRELVREYRAIVEEILELRGDDGRVASWVRAIVEPGALADTSGFAPDLTFEQKVKVLEALDVTERLELVIGLQRERLAELQVRRKIREDVEEGAAKQQREYVLRQQMESIRRELGEDEGSAADDLRRQVEESAMPENVREQAERELDRLERMGEANGEAQMLRSYLEWMVSVPWGESSEEDLDPGHTREVLDADHAGLEDVKDR